VIALSILVTYLGFLIGLGWFARRSFTGTAADYFVASHSIGPFLMLMSVFGTTMTAFALVGSTGEAYRTGIGVYGKMASWSGLVHSAVFFLVGIRVWALGRRHGYMTQCEFLRDRFQSNALGTLLFPILVLLVIPYLLIGLIGAGSVVRSLTVGALPTLFPGTQGGIPPYLGSGVVAVVVLSYVFFGGLRGATWANAFQTCVFMISGVVAFVVIAIKLGGPSAASQNALNSNPEKLIRGAAIPHLQFFTYLFVPLSVGMFPHLFQHWLTARDARAFRATVIWHPICIMVVWVPCVLIGIWATSATLDGALVVPANHPPNSELAIMVSKLTHPALAGFLGAGILAAIMSSLDSQFFCLGTMFTNDVVVYIYGKDRFDDSQKIKMARCFIVIVVCLTYGLTLLEPRRIFTLGVWCFSGFASLFPLIFAALYWRRATRAGAIASVLAAVSSWAVLFARANYGLTPDFLVMDMMPVTWMILASSATMFVVSLASLPLPPNHVDRFFIPEPGQGATS